MNGKPVVLPSPEELARLYKLVRGGDIAGVHKELKHIESLGSQYETFVTEMRQLAQRFHMKQIRDLLTIYLGDDV